MYIEEIGDTDVVIFDKKGEWGAVATILVRGSSQSLMDDVERAIDDAVNTYKALTKDNRVIRVLRSSYPKTEFSFLLEQVRSRSNWRVRSSPSVRSARDWNSTP